jgi:aspartyl-tRNA(Asn)/glutamyl-tRNA(Gln) amidotransferase subunit A
MTGPRPLRSADETAALIAAVEDKGLNATIAFDHTVLKRQAEEISGRPDPTRLNGLPIGVKDNICTIEYPTTCASHILQDYRSPYEATAVSRLKDAGGIVACKTNLDEFAMGSSTEHSAFGRVRHPHDPDRVPGGSSGGSAALVAAGALSVALGSETGGSVRQPAAFCGVVGVKPSYGRVSRHGLVAFGSSLDQIGVFGKTVADAASLLEVISGRDAKDSTCADLDQLDAPLERQDLDGIVIGVPSEYFPDDLDPAIRAACDRAIAALRQAGASVRAVSLPHTSLAVPCYYVIAPAEASANLARYDGVRYGLRVPQDDLHALYSETRGSGFGAEVRRRIIVGTYVLSSGYYEAYYAKAQHARGRIARDFDDVYASGVDLLFTPTTPTTAFRAGERLRDPVAMYLADVFVCSANLVGIPAVSLPIGRTQGLPIGGQLMARAYEEGLLLDAAHVLEERVHAIEEI